MTYQWLARNAMLPILDIYRRRRVAQYWRSLEKSQWLTPDSLGKLQEERIRALLKHAYDNVPYYHRMFQMLGLHPSEVRSLKDLEKLPVLKKQSISNSPEEFTARNFSKPEMITRYTSGTTAESLRFYTTGEGISWGTAAMLRAYGWGGYKLGDKHGVITAFTDSELESSTFRFINLLQRQHVLLNAFDVSAVSIAASARKMRTLRPKFLFGYSWGIHMLANHFLSKGIQPRGLQSVFTSAETLLPSRRRVIEKVFGCAVYDVYGSREFSTMGSECEKHSGYHIQSENVVLEFVKDGENVGQGETGKILVTDLHNYAMPFIRYDIGDMGKPSEDECPCGRGLPLFESLEGREYEFFVTGDESILYLRNLDTIFENLPVQMFQIVQTSLDEILVKIVAADGYSEKDTEFIRKNIAWNPRSSTKIQVQKVESIASESSGKKRYVISKLPNNAGLGGDE